MARTRAPSRRCLGPRAHAPARRAGGRPTSRTAHSSRPARGHSIRWPRTSASRHQTSQSPDPPNPTPGTPSVLGSWGRAGRAPRCVASRRVARGGCQCQAGEPRPPSCDRDGTRHQARDGCIHPSPHLARLMLRVAVVFARGWGWGGRTAGSSRDRFRANHCDLAEIAIAMAIAIAIASLLCARLHTFDESWWGLLRPRSLMMNHWMASWTPWCPFLNPSYCTAMYPLCALSGPGFIRDFGSSSDGVHCVFRILSKQQVAKLADRVWVRWVLSSAPTLVAVSPSLPGLSDTTLVYLCILS